MSKPLSSRDWFGKISAAFILGFTLALALSGLFRWATDYGDAYFSSKGQLGMWIMALTWPLILSFVFLFRSASRAWLWLALANLAAWAPLVALGELQS
ncbi:hypothetical protein [Novosphingobium sp. ZW T3_23]|uniref:hypothetical protein n=1 Tax=Novosphingobium sp. ZW T3_23 TaxID=3378084 RepID=UPI00385496F2